MSDAQTLPPERYWALRRSFREAGVYGGVILNEICSQLPVYDYPEGTTVATFDHAGNVQVSPLRGHRLWVPMFPTKFEDEPLYLGKLRGALPDADELRVISKPPMIIGTMTGPIIDTGERGYWAVRLPRTP